MGTLKDVINKLQNEDINSLESLENNYMLENYIRTIAPANMSKPIAQAIAQGVTKGNPLATPVNSFRSPISAATFDILIERETSNIPAALPIVLFGSLDRESDYVEIMNPELPAGTTYTVAATTDRKGLKFTFTAAAGTDIVTVQCNETPYLNLLRATQGSLFKMQQNKLLISDVAMQSQFSQKVQLVDRSMFGSNRYDTFTPNQFKTDLQNQNDIRTIDAIINVDFEKSLLFKVAAYNTADEPFLVTLTSFIQKFEKPSAYGF